jgi:hypothetical protein
VRVAQLGPLHLHGAEGGFQRARLLPAVAVGRRQVIGLCDQAPLVPAAAELLADDLLDHALERQPHRQAGHLLDGAQQVPVGAGPEQLVDLGTDGLGGRYSTSHGCRSPFADLVVSKEPTPVARLHPGCDATLAVGLLVLRACPVDDGRSA